MRSIYRRTIFESGVALMVLACNGVESAAPPEAPPKEVEPQEPPIPVRVAAGESHACALMSDGTARCWGSNSSIELGHPCRLGHTPANCFVASRVFGDAELEQPLDRVVDLALGSSGSCAIRDHRTVWCWGNNAFGAFATGEFGSSATFPPVPSLVADVLQLSLGWSCCAILTDETLWCWSTWSDTTSATPVRSPWVDRATGLPPFEPECVLIPDGTVACRGPNDAGQIGDGTFEDRNAFTQVVAIDDVIQVSRVSHGASCALHASGSVSCWGSGFALGNGEDLNSPVPLEVLLPGPALAISSGMGASCAILDDGSLWCWGDNRWGQLGDGTTVWARLVPVQVVDLDDVVQVAMGFDFTCALRGDHTVWCWGDNYFGQLGTGYANGPHPDDWALSSTVPKRVVFEDELELSSP
jgi:alpha-tubulin suppressor-like RCC1 family protein